MRILLVAAFQRITAYLWLVFASLLVVYSLFLDTAESLTS